MDTKPSSSSGVPTVRVALAAPGDAVAMDRARYVLHGELGKGGMGEVRLVEDGWIGREVAVKTIVSAQSASPTMRERFLREVRIQGQLEHPSIVPVYDLGVDEAGSVFFTMKRVVGRTLASIVRGLAKRDVETLQAFPRNGLLAVFRQVCLAIAYAHSRGVVHRDLKPANVMVGDFGEVYVLDWGIARLIGEAPGDEVEYMLGTPGYMAPEQVADANEADERADVYSLGAILFELLALEPWHPLASTSEAIASTATQTSARPSSRAPDRDIPPELDDLCARATATEPAQRVQHARELADVIERYLEGDRDLERRRHQAQRHAAAARAAHERVATGGPDAVAARREALREAGRAVALDPEGREGLRAAVEMMLEPPPEVPPEVNEELARAQSDRVRAGLAPGVVVFATFMIAALAVPLIAGPVSLLVPALVAAAMGIAILLCLHLLRRADLSNQRWSTLAIAACAAVAIALTSCYLGSMILVPPLAVALANALSTSHLRWRAFVALSTLAVLVPSVVEWAGLVPHSYEFRAEGLLVKPIVMELAEVPVRLLNIFVTISVLVGSALYLRRVMLVEAELRRMWLLHNWHLRQMARLDDAPAK